MDEDHGVLVVGATLLIVPEGDDLNVYDDLVNSILLAQLVANKQVEKERGVNWYDAYIRVLDDFWLRHQRTRQTWQASSDTEETSLGFFTAALSKGALGQTRIMSTVLARVAKMSGEAPAIQLLRSYMAVSATQQAATATATATATAPSALSTVRLLVTHANSPSSITTSYIEFKTCKALASNPFQQSYQPDEVRGLIQVNHARANFIDIRFSPARDAIALKVRDRRVGSVATLVLPRALES